MAEMGRTLGGKSVVLKWMHEVHDPAVPCLDGVGWGTEYGM